MASLSVAATAIEICRAQSRSVLVDRRVVVPAATIKVAPFVLRLVAMVLWSRSITMMFWSPMAVVRIIMCSPVCPSTMQHRGTKIVPCVPIVTVVVAMAVVTVVVVILAVMPQMMVSPVQGVKGTDSPEAVVVEVVIVLIGVVIDRITRWIVVVYPGGLMLQDLFWLVVRDIHHLVVSGFNDDRVVLHVDVLLLV